MGLRLPLDGRLNQPSVGPSLADRVRLILETRPLRVPWRPELGCDLDVIVGKPLTAERLSGYLAKVFSIRVAYFSAKAISTS